MRSKPKLIRVHQSMRNTFHLAFYPLPKITISMMMMMMMMMMMIDDDDDDDDDVV